MGGPRVKDARRTDPIGRARSAQREVDDAVAELYAAH